MLLSRREVIHNFFYTLLLNFGCAGLCCCPGDFSVLAARGGHLQLWCEGFSLPWVVSRALELQQLQHMGSVVGSRALEHRLSSCGAWAYLLLGIWDLPGSGIECLSPALAGRFFTTEPPGKPYP